MKKNSGSFSIFIFILIGVIGFIYLASHLSSEGAFPKTNYFVKVEVKENFISITAPAGVIQSLVATSSADLQKGLSQRFFLPADQGMLFVFDEVGSHGFWMKDTLIPLDMVWIKSDKTVVGVTPNVMPDSYPQTFLPPEPISYVLELNAGAAEKFGIATGTPLTFVI